MVSMMLCSSLVGANGGVVGASMLGGGEGLGFMDRVPWRD